VETAKEGWGGRETGRAPRASFTGGFCDRAGLDAAHDIGRLMGSVVVKGNRRGGGVLHLRAVFWEEEKEP